MELAFSPQLVHLLLSTVLGFIIGLELKAYHHTYNTDAFSPPFGTTRTYTFAGMLGYIAYALEPRHFVIYIVLFLALSLYFALFYHHMIRKGKPSILPYLVLVGVYAFGPLSERFGVWMAALLFVLIIFVLNVSRNFRIESRVALEEFETLAKMVLLSAVILPLLPDTPLPTPYLPISPFKLWLAVVVISAISYGGYLLQKYLFPNKGYFLTGLIGGTYSSTATTVVLSRKIRAAQHTSVLTASIIAATSMMYLRVVVVAFVFNRAVALALTPYLIALSLSGFVLAFLFLHRNGTKENDIVFVDKNPLELGTAFLFAMLFAAMMALTRFVMQHFGQSGLEALAFVVGFADIDPFILSLLTGKYSVTQAQIVSAVFIAIGSNNLLKAAYALWFGGFKHNWRSALVLALLGIATVALAFVVR
jgi:uncharacterized membrane protein (DUF4010 family)